MIIKSIIKHHLTWLSTVLAFGVLAACAGGGSDGGTDDDISPTSVVPREAMQMGPVASAPATGPYTQHTVGPYKVSNNTWGTTSLPRGWTQQTGASTLQPDGSVAFAAVWNFPDQCTGTDTECEVLSFPEVIYGRAAGIDPAPGAKLPAPLSGIHRLVTQYSRIEGTASGLGHVTYDVWISRSPDSMAPADRLVEIMVPVEPIGGYGVPDDPPQATEGRQNQLAQGRDARFYVERADIGGQRYDVYFTPPRGTTTWNLVVFEPVEPAGRNGHILNWLPLIRYAQQRQWAPTQAYLANVEFGIEAVSHPAGSRGDLTLSGFKVTVN